MSESRLKQMNRIARIFESVSSVNLRRFAILTLKGLAVLHLVRTSMIKSYKLNFGDFYGRKKLAFYLGFTVV